jgi:hypothetical protein
LSSVASAGLKVTPWLDVPVAGAVEDVVQVNVPLTDAVPPVSVEDANDWPYVIALAVGHADTVGVALFTVTLTEPVTVL